MGSVGTLVVILGLTGLFAAILILCSPYGKPAIKIRLLLKTSDNRIKLFDYDSKSIKDLLVDQSRGISAFTSVNESIYYATNNPNETVFSWLTEYKNLPYYIEKWTKTALAADQRSGIVYVLDGAAGKVNSVDINKRYHSEIVSGLDEPKDILVAPSNIYILQSSSIVETSLGSYGGYSTVVEHPNLQAFGLSISDDTLYYSDGKQVFSYNYYKEKTAYDLANVTSLVVIENRLFFITNVQNSTDKVLKSCIMNNGICAVEELYRDSKLEEVKFYGPPYGSWLPCLGYARCNHMHPCHCECSEGWTLSDSEKECIPEDYLFVNIDNTVIAKYRFDQPNLVEPLLTTKSAIQSFDLIESSFIYATDEPNQPILSTNHINFLHHTAGWVKTGISSAADNGYYLIYVADEVHGHVGIAKGTDNHGQTYAQILLSGLDKPRNVLVDPELGLMFVLQASSVLWANMDGTNQKILYKNSDLAAIALDQRDKKLYIALPNAIVSIDYETNKRRPIAQLTGFAKIISLAVVSGDLYAVIERQFVKRSIELCHLRNDETCEFEVVYENDLIVDIKSKFDSKEVRKRRNGVCHDVYSRGCDHFCLLRSDSERYSCACSIGSKLNDDKKTCRAS